MSVNSKTMAVITSVLDRIPGLRSGTPRRNTLIILSYALLLFLGIGLFDRFSELPF